MNKKKRALALGLAATQLTSLTAVVAPLTAATAFAEEDTTPASGDTTIPSAANDTATTAAATAAPAATTPGADSLTEVKVGTTAGTDTVTSLADAVTAVKANGTITLETDVTLSAVVNITKSLTIKLNGHTIKGTDTFPDTPANHKDGTLFEIGTSAEATGSIVKVVGDSEGKIVSRARSFQVKGKSELDLDSATVEGRVAGYDTAVLKITGSKIKGTTDTAVFALNAANVTITDSELSATANGSLIAGSGGDMEKSCTVTVSGSKLTGAIYKPQLGTLTLGKGTAVTSDGVGVGIKAGTLIVDGATITAKGNHNGEPANIETGISTTGAGILIEDNSSYQDSVVIDIKDGSTVTSTNSTALQWFTNQDASPRFPKITVAGTLTNNATYSAVKMTLPAGYRASDTYAISKYTVAYPAYAAITASGKDQAAIVADAVAKVKAASLKFKDASNADLATQPTIKTEYTVTVDEKGATAVAPNGMVKSVKVPVTITLTEAGKAKYALGENEENELTITVECTAAIANEAGIKLVTTGLTGVENCDIEVKKGSTKLDLTKDTIKEDDSLTITVTPKKGYYFSTAAGATAKIGSTDVSLTAGSANQDTGFTWTYTVPELKNSTDALTITLTGELKARPVITPVLVAPDGATTLTGAELTRFKDNLKLYESVLTETKDGNYEIVVSAEYGKMKGTVAAGSGGKNVLLLFKMSTLDKTAGTKTITVTQNNAAIDDTDHWYSDASKYVSSTAVDNNYEYFTLWLSLTPGRLNGTDKVTIKLSGDHADDKTVAIKFKDTTTYTIKAGNDLKSDDYDVMVGEVTDGMATVTVTPKDGKIIKTATLTKGDGSTELALTPDGSSYTAKVKVSELISNSDKELGKVDVVLKKTAGAGCLAVTVAEASAIVPVGCTVGIERPSSMTDNLAELTRYQNNRLLYVDNLTWDASARTATVKVPSALMDGDDTGASAGANVCLVLKFKEKLTAPQISAIVGKGQIEQIDITDGWKFVEGATVADQGQYAVLWINAHSDNIPANGNKVVIYEDNNPSGKVIATVVVEKVPVVSKNATPAVEQTYNGKTDDQIKTALATYVTGTLLDKDGAANSDLNVEVGELPATNGKAYVTVTVTSKKDGVLLGDTTAHKVLDKIEVKVPVDITRTGKKITLAECKNGTATLSTTTAAKNAKVTVTAKPDEGYELDKITVKGKDGKEVAVTNGTFTMPDQEVTVTVTFKLKAASSYDIKAAESENGTVNFTVGGKTVTAAKKGDTVTVVATAADGYKTGDITVTGASGDVKVTDNTFVMPGEAVTVTVEFVKDTAPVEDVYAIDLADTTHGTFKAQVGGKDAKEAVKGDEVTIVTTPASGYRDGTISVKTKSGKTVTVRSKKFTMPDENVTITVTFSRKSSGGSSGGSASRPSGGSSSGSSGSTSTTPSVSDSATVSTIKGTTSGGTAKLDGVVVMTTDAIKAAADNKVNLEVKVDDDYTWTIDADKLSDKNSVLRLSVSSATVNETETAKIKKSTGAEDRNEKAFSVVADNLGTGATLKVKTVAKSTDNAKKFANLYKTNADGTLAFVAAAPIDKDGNAVLPITDKGTYTIVASTETKMPGDINNDCKVDLTDLTAMLTSYVNNTNPKSFDNYKLDHDNSGELALSDLVAMLRDYSNGRL